MFKYISAAYYTCIGFFKSIAMKRNIPYIIKDSLYPDGIICIYTFNNMVFLHNYNEYVYCKDKSNHRYTRVPYRFLGKHIKLDKILNK